MPFGCESYVDDITATSSRPVFAESPMPFGCESYVDRSLMFSKRCASRCVTNAFRL